MTTSPTPPRLRKLATFFFAVVALACVPSAASAALPDPMETGSYAVTEVQQYKAGTVNLQEPNYTGGAATGTAAAATLQVRGSLYYPTDRSTPAPFILLVHGNHGSCQLANNNLSPAIPSGGSAPNCSVFERNDLGYGYLAHNLASHGYVVASIDQDQLMYYQDTSAKGMHQRRLMIAAQLDAFYKANADGWAADDADHNLGTSLVGKIDMTKIGLMGHSRGGDAVTSFMDYNRTRPAPGRRYPLAGVISLAPVDYERRAPYGSAYLTILPACDGDVSNLQGARFFERSQYAAPGDPFPKIQQYVLGTNHNFFNTVWSADNDDSTGNDIACGPTVNSTTTSIRLSGGVSAAGQMASAGGNLLGTYTRNTAFSSDPALMGDQQKVGLATMASFFRRYVGQETAFDPYMTGELADTPGNNQLPAAACPTSTTGTRIDCNQYLQTNYFAPPAEREDVIALDSDNLTTVSSLGTSIVASGFSNPYTDDGGVIPKPETTTSGIDWCNPEPDHFQPSYVGDVLQPAAAKPCPLPATNAVGGQSSNRENGPVNQSYGNQLAVAWNDPLSSDGTPASLATRIPSADGNLSDKKALSLSAAVNFFDSRNPSRAGDAQWNPALTKQDFAIQLTDAAGNTASVHAGDRNYGTALQQTTGNSNARVHIILNQIRVPLADFADEGIDLTKVRKLTLLFGGTGYPATGSIQLSDIRFQEAAGGPTVLNGLSTSISPQQILDETPRNQPSSSEPDVLWVGTGGAGSTCADSKAPTVGTTSKSVKGRAVTIKGKAADTGCGKLKSVELAIAKKSGSKYRFVTGNGKLSKPLPKSAPLTLVAAGTKKWSLKVGKLPKGSYSVTVKAIDGGGNVTAKTIGSFKIG
ncbi:MAG: alpha/beta hydrolase [Solirubrobacterales bacterium]